MRNALFTQAALLTVAMALASCQSIPSTTPSTLNSATELPVEIVALKKISDAQPDNPEYLFKLGIAYAQAAEQQSSKKMQAQAIATLQQVLRIAPGNTSTLKALYTLYYADATKGKADAFTQASAIFKQLPPSGREQINPPSLALFIHDYIAQKNAGRDEPAVLYHHLLAAIREQPKGDRAYLQLAKMYRDANYYPLALATLKLGEHEIDHSMDLYSAIGETYVARGTATGCLTDQNNNLNNAIAYYKRAIASKPGEINTHYALAELFFTKGLRALAISEIEIILDIKPSKEYLAMAAQYYGFTGQTTKATEVFQRAKTEGLDNTYPATHQIYMLIGDWENAAHAFTEYVNTRDDLSVYDLIKADMINTLTKGSIEQTAIKTRFATKKLVFSNNWERNLHGLWTGKTTDTELTAIATDRCKRTELLFYSGYRNYLAGNRQEARRQFKSVIAGGAPNFIEQPLASYFLHRLD